MATDMKYPPALVEPFDALEHLLFENIQIPFKGL